MNISEGLALYKNLKTRYQELVNLREQSSEKERRFYGSSGDKEVVKEPTYKIKDVDKKINLIAKEMRRLDVVIKLTNMTAKIDFTLDESVWDAIE